ncbi:HNH endonuclease [Chimaeribacter arupi]|uniref:HNH endonuclease n=1 Tax=Chimaeribacter arupi TaxID=2060066 RepID=UPI000C79775F|nr:HNH endonuclease [Chimaeribacter arupi]PLR32498.1 restriction endonuclease [Chimaeribacter arupi]
MDKEAGYTVIAENDESQWQDQTGAVYHFPKRYLGLLTPGTQVVYYKGKLRDKQHAAKRLSDQPHYFGIATIGQVYQDKNSSKGDHFALIENYQPFTAALFAKTASGYYETIPENRLSNYWRDGVRAISQQDYEAIIAAAQLAPIAAATAQPAAMIPSAEPETERESDEESLYSGVEGQKRMKYVTFYERNPKLKEQAKQLHGTTCCICGFNFGKVYGEYGEGFIHIHHLVPISAGDGKEKTVNPETDLVPVCANCHSIIHRKKDRTLSIDKMKAIINISHR